MSTFSGNSSIKYSGTQVVLNVTGNNVSGNYVVPAGKTLIGSWWFQNQNGGATTISIDGTAIAVSTGTSFAPTSGNLFVNAGSTVLIQTSSIGAGAIHGVLQENTP